MGEHRIGVRVNLSPLAEKAFLEACKPHGGQTDFITKAIEFYANRGDEVLHRLDSIESHLKSLKNNGLITTASTPVVEAVQPVQGENPVRIQESVQQEIVTPKEPVVKREESTEAKSSESVSIQQEKKEDKALTDQEEEMDKESANNSQRMQAYSTLRGFLGDDD